MIVRGGDLAHHAQLGIALEVDHLPPLARLGKQLVHLGGEALAGGRGQQQLPLRPVHHQPGDPGIGVDIDHALHRFAETARTGQLVRAQRVEPAIVRGEQQLVRGLAMDRESRPVAFLELPFLVQRQVSARRADPAPLGEDHRDRLLLDHGVGIEFHRRRRLRDGGPARAERGVLGIILAQGRKVALQPRTLPRRAGEQLLELVLLGQQIVLFLPELHLLELAQAPQAHVEDCFGLAVGEAEFRHHHRLGLVLGADDLDHPVEIEEGNDITFDQFQPVGDLAQPVLGAPLEDVDLARHPVRQQFLQPHHHRRARGVEHVEVEREAGLEVGQLVERFLEQLGVDIATLGNQHDADLLVALVAHILEDGQLAVGDQLGDLLDQLALGHLVGDFGNHQLILPAAQPLYPGVAVGLVLRLGGMEAPAHAEAAAPALVSGGDRRRAVHHQPAGGEIGSLEQLHQPRMLDMRIIDQLQRGVDHLGGIVAGDAGRHADRNPAGAIGQQVGEQTGEERGLLLLIVVGRDEIDRAFVQPFHQLHRRLGQAAFGVAFGGGVIAVDIAEVPLPLDQRVAQREWLGEADQRIVEGKVSVRVELAHHVADHAAALFERAVGRKSQLPHAPQDPAVNRLQSVAQIRQRARRDRGHGIDQVPLLQRAVERGVDDRVERVFFGIDNGNHAARPSSATALRTARNGQLSPSIDEVKAIQKEASCPNVS